MKQSFSLMNRPLLALMLWTLSADASMAADDTRPATQTVKYRITGLFSPDREEDLREAVKKIPNVKVMQIDYKFAEVTFAIEPVEPFVKARPEQIVERLDNLIKTASFHTFGVKPLSTLPKDKWALVEIPVVGLDCKGCCLAAYESIARIDGVERATASFKDGLVTASIDPAKTDRAALEAALKKARVELKNP